MTQRRTDDVQRVGEILDMALLRPPHERAALIAGLCAGDEGLQNEATSLLRALDRAGHLIEPKAAEAPVDASIARPELHGLVVGPYRIGARIGVGGMGEVYAAQDTRLGRTVAVKLLPRELALDPGRRAMLEHEAKVLATLTHQNIGAIYGIEDSVLGPVLVLEYIEGKTLAEHMAEGPIPVDEARSIAREILHALEAAHAAGVIHRDIKPSNVKLMPSGGVKVLDFGIAKLTVDPNAGPRPSSGAAGALTSAGRLIGTPAYMSPEQARGRSVDQRADLWAFGCVLYEMLSGNPAFRGETATDTIAAILRAEPDWSRLPPSTSIAERRLLRRRLEKDSDNRLRDAGDARLELDESSLKADAPAQFERRVWRGSPGRILAAGLALGGLGVGALWLGQWSGSSKGSIPDTSPTRFTIDLPTEVGLGINSIGGAMAVSPDGRSLAFVAGSPPIGPGLFLRRLDAFEPVSLPGTLGAAAPCFSPDGMWIAYQDMSGPGQIMKVRTSGGPPLAIASTPAAVTAGLCWGPDDTITFSRPAVGALLRVAASGGTMTPLTELSAEQHEYSHFQPEVLPDGSVILFTCLRLESDRFRLSIESVVPSTRQRRRVLDDACQPRYMPGGHLLYYEGGALMTVGFDAHRLATTGEPRKLLSPLAGIEIAPPPRYAVSPAGTLAYLPAPTNYLETELAWFSRDGSTTTALRTGEFIDSLRLSPDGRRVAFAAGSPASEIWVHDLVRNSRTRVTRGGRRYYPVWTPDGRRIAFKNEDAGRIEWMPADGTAEPELLFIGHSGPHCYPNAFTADGASLIFTMADPPDGPEDLYVLRLQGDGMLRRIFTVPAHANRFGARLSPDGTLISYTSEESGTWEVFVQPYPALDHRVQVSAGGGFRSAWSGDGKTLFYRLQDRLYAADISTTPELAASTPRLILRDMPETRYDVAPDGTRFLVAQSSGGFVPQTRINVVLNWAHEAGLDLPLQAR